MSTRVARLKEQARPEPEPINEPPHHAGDTPEDSQWVTYREGVSRLCFGLKSGKEWMNSYTHLAETVLTRDEAGRDVLVFTFTNHTVTVMGHNLRQVHHHLAMENVSIIAECPAQIPDPEEGAVITSISIKTNQGEDNE